MDKGAILMETLIKIFDTYNRSEGKSSDTLSLAQFLEGRSPSRV